MSANISQYRTAFSQSQALLDALEIRRFPVSLLQVFRCKTDSPILVSSFSDYKAWATSMGWDCPDELKDAKCYYHPSTQVYIVVYNETRPINRTRFSLAHELGHIVLGHLNDERTEICRGGLDDVTYYTMEGAANTFAGNFLAPPILIHERICGGRFDVSDISDFFSISREAARTYRRQDYEHWLKMTPSRHEKRILKRCRDWLFPRNCGKCAATTYDTHAKHCYACGGRLPRHFVSAGGKSMKYPGIELDVQFRALECPICRNTDQAESGEFCIICGTGLVNYCSDDNPFDGCNYTDPLPGNARFCPHCGNKSTFFARGLLKAWNHKEKETEFTELADDDGELPF